MPSTQLNDGTERWQVTVLRTIATGGSGVEELRDRLDAHRLWLDESGERAQREQARVAHTLETILRAELNRRILSALPQDGIDGLVERIRQRELDPYHAAQILLGENE